MRTVSALAGLAALGAGCAVTAWLLRDGDAERLRAERERQELKAVAERLMRERRVAEVIVSGQERDADGVVQHTEIQFLELDRDGHPLTPRTFCLAGQVIYFDGLVIKFDKDLVAAGDPLRGHSIILFRRVFSEEVAPKDGPLIDPERDIPDVFRVNPRASDVERRLWQRFWTYATDPAAAAKEGVRVAQGEAVYAPMTAGQRWTLTLDADGGLNLRPLGPAATQAARRGPQLEGPCG